MASAFAIHRCSCFAAGYVDEVGYGCGYFLVERARHLLSSTPAALHLQYGYMM